MAAPSYYVPPFGSSSFERSREASVENFLPSGTPFSIRALDKLDRYSNQTGEGR